MKNRVSFCFPFIAAFVTACMLMGCQSVNMEMPTWFEDEENTVTDQQDFTQQVQVPPNSNVLEIIHFNGNVEVEGWSEPYILLQGLKRATGATVDEARGKLEFISIYPYEKAPDRLVLEYNGPSTVLNLGRSSTGIDVKISVPQTMPVEINCRRGDVKVSNMQANLKIDHRDGDVHVQNISGQTEIESHGRNVIVKNIDKRVNLKTVNANLSVDTVNDNVTVDHSKGDAGIKNIAGIIIFYGNESQIEIQEVQGRIQVENSGGDVECDTFHSGVQVNVKDGTLHLHPKAGVSQGYTCTVENGDLILRAPAGASMLAELKTEDGSIQSDFNLPVSANKGVSTAKGAVNGGQVPVTLTVTNGTLSLLKEQ